MHNKNKLLTTEAAAERLDVAPTTVRDWLRKGILKGTKVGGGKLWRISEEAIDEFLKVGQGKTDVAGEENVEL